MLWQNMSFFIYLAIFNNSEFPLPGRENFGRTFWGFTELLFDFPLVRWTTQAVSDDIQFELCTGYFH